MGDIGLASKVGKLSDIGKIVKPGSFIAVGGGWSCNKPMAIIREIIRQNINKLEAMSIVGGWEMEWLIASNSLEHLIFSFLSEGCSMIKGLEASRLGMPFAAFRGPTGSDIIKEAPQLYKTIKCPFTGMELTTIQAIKPDVALIHAQRADEQGNVQLFGTSASDLDMAIASKNVIVTVEEIVSGDQLRKEKSATKLFRTNVSMVVPVKFGASPCSCVPYYPAHLQQLMKDVQGLNAKEATADYIKKTIGSSEEEYWNNVGGETAKKKLIGLSKKAVSIDFPAKLEKEKAEEFDAADQMVVCIARTIDDYDTTVLGSFTPLAYAAYMLAKLTNAPNSFVVGYSGVDPLPFQLGFHTSEVACTQYSAGLWSMTECIEALHIRGDGDVEAVSSAQMDANADINISWLPMPIMDAEGKPTGQMNPRGLRLPGGAGAPVVFGLHKKSIAYFAGHSKMVFVPKVNYITGTRFYLTDEERKAQGLKPGPVIVVTNLCVMQMVARGKWKVLSLHKGVKAEDVINNTGFPVEIAADCPVTEPPTKQEVDLIKKIDPQGIRKLDFMSGKKRAEMLPAIINAEWDAV